jgi:hypothetical protein
MHDVLKTSRTGHLSALIMYHLHPVMPEKLHDTLARYINIHTLDDPELQKRYEARQDHTGHDHGDKGDLPPADGGELILPSDFEKVLSELPPERQEEVRTLLMRSLNKSQTEAQPDLFDSLWDAFTEVKDSKDLTSLMNRLQPSDKAMASMSDWLTQPADTGLAAPADIAPEAPLLVPDDGPAPMPVIAATTPEIAQSPSRRDELLDQLSAEYSSSSLARARIRKDIESQLKDVPDAVAVSALEDYLADLQATRAAKSGRAVWDPDPSTNATTTLKARIDRQTARDLPAAGGDSRLR